MKLFVDIETRSDDGLQRYQREMQQAIHGLREQATGVQRLQEQARQATGSFGQLQSTLGGLGRMLGATFTVAALAQTIRQTVEWADRIDHLSAKLGISAEAVQRLEHVASRAGGSIDQVGRAMQHMSRLVTDGGGSAAGAFASLGLSVEQLRQQAPDEALLSIGRALTQIEHPTERQALALRTLGSAGSDLLPMFQAMASEMRTVAVVHEDFVRQAAQVSDAWADLRQAGHVFVTTTIASLLPNLDGLAQGASRAAQTYSDLAAAMARVRDEQSGVAARLPLDPRAVQREMDQIELDRMFTQAGAPRREAPPGYQAPVVSIEEARRIDQQHTREMERLRREEEKRREEAERRLEEQRRWLQQHEDHVVQRLNSVVPSGIGRGGAEDPGLVFWADQRRVAERLVDFRQRAQAITREFVRSQMTAKDRAIDIAKQWRTDMIRELDPQRILDPEAYDEAVTAIEGHFTEMVDEALGGTNRLRVEFERLRDSGTATAREIEDAFDRWQKSRGGGDFVRTWEQALSRVSSLFRQLSGLVGGRLGAELSLAGQSVDALMGSLRGQHDAMNLWEKGDKTGSAIAWASSGLSMATGMQAATATGGTGARIATGAGYGAAQGTMTGLSLGAMKGVSIGKWAGPWGAAIGAGVGAIVGAIRGYRAKMRAHKEGREAYASWEDDILESLTWAQAAEAQGARWRATNIAVRDAYMSVGLSGARAMQDLGRAQEAARISAAAFEVAVARINTVLDEAKADQERLNAAIEKYGFTIEEVGEAWRLSALRETARDLIEDWRVLVNSGIDVATVNARMGEAISEYYQTAIRTGTEVPIAFEPILRQLVRTGSLLDANGRAIDDLTLDSTRWARTLGQEFDRVIEKLEDLFQRVFGVSDAIRDIPRTIEIDVVWREMPEDAMSTGRRAVPRADPNARVVPRGYVEPFYPGGANVMHDGGIVRTGFGRTPGLRSDEVPIIAQAGEGILSRFATNLIGGKPALDALNDGRLDRAFMVRPRLDMAEAGRRLDAAMDFSRYRDHLDGPHAIGSPRIEQALLGNISRESLTTSSDESVTVTMGPVAITVEGTSGNPRAIADAIATELPRAIAQNRAGLRTTLRRQLRSA